MKTENLKTKLVNLLDDLNDFELINVFNDYCEKEYNGFHYIYDMDELDGILSNSTPTEVLLAVDTGRFDIYEKYFGYDGCGAIESFDDPRDFSVLCLEDIADYILRTGKWLNSEEICELLGEEGEE